MDKVPPSSLPSFCPLSRLSPGCPTGPQRPKHSPGPNHTGSYAIWACCWQLGLPVLPKLPGRSPVSPLLACLPHLSPPNPPIPQPSPPQPFTSTHVRVTAHSSMDTPSFKSSHPRTLGSPAHGSTNTPSFKSFVAVSVTDAPRMRLRAICCPSPSKLPRSSLQSLLHPLILKKGVGWGGKINSNRPRKCWVWPCFYMFFLKNILLLAHTNQFGRMKFTYSHRWF